MTLLQTPTHGSKTKYYKKALEEEHWETVLLQIKELWQTYFRLGWLLATFTGGLNHLLN